MSSVTAASPADDFHSNPNEKLLISAKEAARRLSISERSLWSLTNQRRIPTIRIGRSVRYSVIGLEEWIRQSTQSQYRGGGSRT
ncbi:hypothetical protein Plim_1224 [Planctopirus limnophila DSM 3776]|uniref:Helix-turn-helix domain-containing protein n=1 Tax=Planctopirus limnophila (strain ATCC 43296 / DSM 3776 / IFAM 1008 / Mu 290) TaxID=521674 RepID=D5SUK7_PLAL2|nr:hypothetical protein Plim_1224 [Planctopirus limnophila DSM 3776]